ncbi:chorismate mutase [Ferrimicrobium sp.]|uniref:chorismate mutase n=1 Tax=Ferrimicrobium sp. TaxID=2926050 RepID=UPI002619ABA7|nr:chorismate mutase [Ferrimicrobium sp.]
MGVRAVRGATTVDADTAEAIDENVRELVSAMLERNKLDKEQLISIFFTSTSDLHSMFPAAAARALGFGDVPLMCAQELDIDGAVARCVRVMMHVEDDRDRGLFHHVYLRGAMGLRDDLPD